MQYTSYIRPVPGAQTAVLLVHGIVGTPAHFRELLPLIPGDWSVYNILLDGHGHGVKEFGKTSMAKWEAQVRTQLDEILKTHSQVLIIAHSMGTLFAIREAIRRPLCIAGLFLLNVPLNPHVRLQTSINCLRIVYRKVKPGSSAEAMLRDCGVKDLRRHLVCYIPWIPRFLELMKYARETIPMLPQLHTPTRTFQSRKDELVSMKTCGHLDTHPCITNTILETSGHFRYSRQDTQLLQTRLKELIDQLS